MQWNIRFYKTRGKQNPVQEFILSLPAKDQAKVLRTIKLLESLGIQLREPHSKNIQKGLYELRIGLAGNIQRIFYYLYDGQAFVLLHGFTKKTQKTPAQEINIAVSRMEDDQKQQEEKKNAKKK